MQLHANNFLLRGWETSDAKSLQYHADNPSIPLFLFDRYPSPYTLQNAEEWIAYCREQSPLVNFAIVVDGNAVGGISLEMRTDVYRNTPLVGYWLGEEYWGRGIMPEAVKLITGYAFDYLNVMTVQALVFSANPKSMRVLERAGYEKQGVLKKTILKNGIVHDEHVYAAFNNAFTTSF